MKKLLQGAALMGAVLFCFCGAASAAESNGIYNLSVETAYSGSVTVTPQTAAGAGITSSSTTINGAEVAGFYAGAVKLQVAYTGAEEGAQYLILGLNVADGVPTEGNIVYIDQIAAPAGGVTFSLYPSKLEGGKTYSICLSSDAASEISTYTKVASFQYYTPYILGDVNESGGITATDALGALQISVRKGTWSENQRLAADANKSGEVTATDAIWILEASVYKRQL